MAQSVNLGRYSFDLSAPLADYTLSYAGAYAASDDPDHPSGLYALVLNNKTPIRMDVMRVIEATRVGVLQTVVSHGVINVGGAERLAFILEKPRGGRLVPPSPQPWPQFKEEDLRLQIVKPLYQAIIALRDRGLAHGAINPANLFYTPGRSINVTLGECVSTLPGFTQPALFETLERAMCTPDGKGNPTFEDDLFALGVTTFLLTIGGNPFATLPAAQIMARRIEQGSSSWLLTSAKVPGPLMEIVRGLCADDPKQRWTPSDMDAWLAGHRVSPKSTGAVTRANRALNFNGTDYVHPRALALALSTDTTAARALVESKELSRWLQRSVGDLAAYERVERLLTSGKLDSSNDTLVAQISMIIDPAAPIRYKKISAMPGGLSGILSSAIINKKTDMQQVVGEIVQQNLPGFWAGMPGNGTPANMLVAKDVDHARQFMNSTAFGAGLERLVYELNKGTPCLSDYFARKYVIHPKQFLLALDEVAGGARPADILDRHGAAWLAAHQPASDEHVFKNISAQRDEGQRHLAILSLLAGIQAQTRTGPVPKLAAWLADLCKPALDRFNNRNMRNELAKNISKLAATGDLRRMQQAIDSPQVLEKDYQGFRNAAQDYRTLAAQIAETDVLLENKITVGILIGRRVAVIVAVTVAGLAICASLASIL